MYFDTEYFKMGTPLASLYTGNVGNAVFVGTVEYPRGLRYRVVTDFGNPMELTREEMEGMYKIPEWFIDHCKLCKQYEEENEYIDNPPEGLINRFRTQVSLIENEIEALL